MCGCCHCMRRQHLSSSDRNGTDATYSSNCSHLSYSPLFDFDGSRQRLHWRDIKLSLSVWVLNKARRACLIAVVVVVVVMCLHRCRWAWSEHQIHPESLISSAVLTLQPLRSMTVLDWKHGCQSFCRRPILADCSLCWSGVAWCLIRY